MIHSTHAFMHPLAPGLLLVFLSAENEEVNLLIQVPFYQRLRKISSVVLQPTRTRPGVVRNSYHALLMLQGSKVFRTVIKRPDQSLVAVSVLFSVLNPTAPSSKAPDQAGL
jgi:hypothetical protein